MAVSHLEDETGNYSEYDKFGRVVYNITSFGFWSMKFYVDEEYITTPYFVIHKYSVLYCIILSLSTIRLFCNK